jgi:hypothetical protein
MPDPAIQAMLSGMGSGRQESNQLMGQAPSGNAPGGSPPPTDPTAPMFKDAIRILGSIAAYLGSQGDTQSNEGIYAALKQVTSVQAKRQKALMDQQMANMTAPPQQPQQAPNG